MEQSIKDYQAESVPLRRFAEPHEQGDPALFLISPSVSPFSEKIQNLHSLILPYRRPRTSPELSFDPMVVSLRTRKSL